jgi:hypothetical protein
VHKSSRGFLIRIQDEFPDWTVCEIFALRAPSGQKIAQLKNLPCDASASQNAVENGHKNDYKKHKIEGVVTQSLNISSVTVAFSTLSFPICLPLNRKYLYLNFYDR